MPKKRTLSWGLGILFAIIIGVLLSTGIRSGVLFQVDQDELVHAQFVYLLLHGFVPYRQFLMTYTPLFHYLISPIFLFAGYTLSTMTLVRWFMVGLFLLRVALSGWIVHRIFGKQVAMIFVVLFLADPFTVYTAMQIRPDNLMMLLYTAGLAMLVAALRTHRNGLFFWSGILLSTSGLVLLKIAPSVVIVFMAILWYGYKHHRYRTLRVFLLGCIGPVLLLFTIAASSGYLHAMLQDIVKFSYAINQSQAFPIPVKHFLEAGNPSLFDLYGEAWSWWPFLEQAEIIAAALGVLFVVITGSNISLVAYILAGSLIVQVAGLAAVHSMFIQYFLPLIWLINVFASVAIVQAMRTLSRWKTLYRVGLVILISLLTVLSYVSAKTNIIRSRAQTNATSAWVTTMLTRIPQNATVYPNLPFRPIAYPITFGGYFIDLPPSVVSQLPPLVSTLEKNHVQYIIKTYDWKAHPQDFFWYVFNQFQEVSPDVYVRNPQ